MHPKSSHVPTAWRMVLITVGGVFVAEVTVMIGFALVDHQLSDAMVTVIDALALVLFVLPLLYFCFYRPMVAHISARLRSEEELEKLAATDPLTAMANRRFGLSFLEQQLKVSKRNSSTLCIGFVDVDGLKAVNDQYGHEEGDRLICFVSEVMKSALRDSDLVFRLGGDEFLLVFPNCDQEQASRILERIEQELKKGNAASNNSYEASLSYGIVEHLPVDTVSTGKLVSLADKAMYSQKNRHGKNRPKRSLNEAPVQHAH